VTTLRPITPLIAIVDGSNIAYFKRSKPSYHHLLEGLESLKRWSELSGYTFTVVADANFPHVVLEHEKTELRHAINRSEIELVPSGSEADKWILKYARRHDAVVISNDRYQKYRKDHRWLFEECRVIRPMRIERLGWEWDWVDLGR
jgi:Zc3h12a-like Ribonuclease NYN domain